MNGPRPTDDELAELLAQPHHWCTKGQWTDTYGYGTCSCGKDKRDALLIRVIAELSASRTEADRLAAKALDVAKRAVVAEHEVERLKKVLLDDRRERLT